ncbi:superoxide dismutase family protein [Bacillus mangrovi]|uniref:Superoxide dismutase family protein n=1 Tax=Metabacillus mangrovi TaxID=1491830 RepID=A0A7X2S8D1_9BACI|nr:superoxide dismutase family protein [Metabacillus mangrovi]MTH55532.1 superoxide dismutase family protein [Metabacillus mangrovi]
MAAAALVLLAGCENEEISSMGTEMFNSDGDSLGTIKLSEQPEGIKFEVALEGLEAGEHGVHIHQNPECEGPEFITAGEHYNPDNKQHGLLNPEGAHLGDLQNIVAESDGKAQAELMGPKLTLKKGAKNSLFFKGGTSIIITEKADDGMSQPAGESGARIACGKITEKEALRKDKKKVEIEAKP